MRSKTLRQMYLNFNRPSSGSKVVQAYYAKYDAINSILLANPKILDLAHADFCQYLSESDQGRDGDYTSEEILRALIVMFIEQDSFRDAVVRIETSEFLRRFIGLGFCRATMDFSFLGKAFSALSSQTWEAINQELSGYALSQNLITGERMRVDTTVYETNIHYPTDSSLLWDSFRVISRTLKQVQLEHPGLGLKHRYHTKKVKKLMQFISRNAKSRSKSTQRQVKTHYRLLIDHVRRVVEISKCVRALAGPHILAVFLLEHFEPLVERVIDQAQRRVFEGEIVPPDEKLYSLFEEHTELLVRGKAGKPVEFGHKILLVQVEKKFIAYYRALLKCQDDPSLLPESLQAYRTLFERFPFLLATDKGFYKGPEQLSALEKNIETVSICKKGRCTQEQTAREHTKKFQDGQRFRAGIEGTISVLKRAFKLKRCLFKGFKNFAASVGCAIFCHNLVVLARF